MKPWIVWTQLQSESLLRIITFQFLLIKRYPNLIADQQEDSAFKSFLIR
jgi:hypothetical protein